MLQGYSGEQATSTILDRNICMHMLLLKPRRQFFCPEFAQFIANQWQRWPLPAEPQLQMLTCLRQLVLRTI